MTARTAALVLWVAATAAAQQTAVSRGRELFRSCQGCHNTASDERKAGPSLRTLFGQVTLRSGGRADDENVRGLILDGLNGMPSFRYVFRPAEIDDLMAYLHTLTGKPAAEQTSAGEAYFNAYCLRCHNPRARTSPGPDLHGHFTLDKAGSVEEGHAGAPPLKEWLGESERRVLFEYLRKY